MIWNIFSIPNGRKYRHTALLYALLVEMSDCAHLWLNWYNGQHNINPFHLHAHTCCSPITTLCHFNVAWRRCALYGVPSTLALIFLAAALKLMSQTCHRHYSVQTELECGPMPNVMAALPNIGGALCSTLQSLADAHY